MKVSAHIEAVTEKVKEDGTAYSITIQGEKTIGEEVITATLNLAKIPESALSEIEEALGVGDIKTAAECGFPVEIEISTPQTKLDVESETESKKNKKVRK